MKYENTNEIFSEYLLYPTFRGKRISLAFSSKLGTTSFKQLRKFYMEKTHRKIWFQQLLCLCGDCMAQKTGNGSVKIWEIYIQSTNLNSDPGAHMHVRNCKHHFERGAQLPSLSNFLYEIRYKHGILVTIKSDQSLFSA